MRDINRIDPLLAKLGEAWKRTPDQRFGQFLYNFFTCYGKDPFYAEDDEWMVGIQAYIDGKDISEAMEAYRNSKEETQTIDFDAIYQSVKTSMIENGKKFEALDLDK